MLQWMMLGTETRALIDQGYASVRQASAEMEAAWGFGRLERWDADFDAGTITFTNPGLVVTAPMQVVGSYVRSTGDWLWAWANPNVAPELARDSALVRDYALQHGVGVLTDPELRLPDEDTWMLVSLVSALAGTRGAYRADADDDLDVFMTFGEPVVQRIGTT